MFSLLMSSVPTPRKAPPSTKNEKLRAPGSCGSWAQSLSAACHASACGIDVSWAYTIPPAIAPAAIVSAMIRANFLRDIRNPPERFCEVSRVRCGRVPNSFAEVRRSVLEYRLQAESSSQRRFRLKAVLQTTPLLIQLGPTVFGILRAHRQVRRQFFLLIVRNQDGQLLLRQPGTGAHRRSGETSLGRFPRRWRRSLAPAK